MENKVKTENQVSLLVQNRLSLGLSSLTKEEVGPLTDMLETANSGKYDLVNLSFKDYKDMAVAGKCANGAEMFIAQLDKILESELAKQPQERLGGVNITTTGIKNVVGDNARFLKGGLSCEN